MSNYAAAGAVLSAQSITKSYGSQPVLENISFTLHEGERVGLIGRNGSGKSTLLRILAGDDQPDAGTVARKKGLRTGILRQDCSLDAGITVGEALDSACGDLRAMMAEFEGLTGVLAAHPEDRAAVERHHELDLELHRLRAWDLDQEAKKIATALRLPDADARVGMLSGGEQRRVDLAATLLRRPDVLLLDEPTNHVDMRSVEWIESFLAGYPGACVLVTHDRYFLELIVSRIVEIEFNRMYSFPGNYEKFLEYKTQIQETEAKNEQSRQIILRRELAWMRRGAPARTTKQKARIRRYHDTVAQGPPLRHKELQFEIPEPPRMGKDILEVDKLCFYYGDRMLFDRFSLLFQKGMRVGVIGPNGCGKTTLVRVLMGLERPKRGKVTVGETTRFLYIDQAHEDIRPEQTIIEYVSGGSNYADVNGRRIYVPGYLQSLLFDMDSVHMPMRNLSGGERNRVLLAKKFLQGGNFLVLDEPTNDLDLPTLRVLEEAIASFDGCAILVSHDRYFLNRLCTHLIAFDESGELTFVTGNYDDYLLHKERRAEHPHPVPAPPRPASKPVPGNGGPKRLTYEEQRDLESMEIQIERAERDAEAIESEIQSPGFFDRDHTEIRAALNRLDEARRRVELLYARWESLEARRNLK